MTKFIPITNVTSRTTLALYRERGWKECESFAKDKIIVYGGSQYRLISKMEKQLSRFGRIKRVVEGLLKTVATLGNSLKSKQFIHYHFKSTTERVNFGELILKNNSVRSDNLQTQEPTIPCSDLQKICEEHHLDQLIFGHTESKGSEHEWGKVSDKAVEQLALLICKAKISSVDWRAFPILEGGKIGLNSSMKRGDAAVSLFGGKGRQGLLGCVSESQAQAVIEIADKNQVEKSEMSLAPSHALYHRRQELKHLEKWKKFHQEKGISTGKEPLQVDITTLDLDLNKRDQGTTLEEVAQFVVDQLNLAIKESASKYRSLTLSEKVTKPYQSLGLPDGLIVLEEEMEQQWLLVVIKALITKKHLFAIERENGSEFVVKC